MWDREPKDLRNLRTEAEREGPALLEPGCDCSQDAVPSHTHTQATRLPGAAHRAGALVPGASLHAPRKLTRRTHEQEQPTGQGRRRAPCCCDRDLLSSHWGAWPPR